MQIDKILASFIQRINIPKVVFALICAVHFKRRPSWKESVLRDSPETRL